MRALPVGDRNGEGGIIPESFALSRFRWNLLLLVCLTVRAAGDVARLVSQPERYWDREEIYNAGVGWYVWYAGLADQLLALQYKAFCGGCSVVAAVAAPMLGLGGDHLLIFKLVPLFLSLVTLAVGGWAVRRHAGDLAGALFLMLFGLPPVGLGDLGLMAWGNHTEGLFFVFLALGLLEGGSPFGLGLVMGLGVWFCRTTLIAPLVIGAVALLRQRAWKQRGLLGLGFGIGLLPMALPASAGDNGYYHFGLAENLLPSGWGEAVARGAPMVTPLAMSWRLYTGVQGMDLLGSAWIPGVTLAFLLLMSLGRRSLRLLILPAMALGFLAAFSISGFPLTRFRPQGSMLGIRYSAPWIALLLATAAVAIAAGYRSGGWRRWCAAAALGLVWGPSLVAQARALQATHLDPAVWETPAVFHHGFGAIATWRMSDARLEAASSSDSKTAAGLLRMRGYRSADAVYNERSTWNAEVERLQALPKGGDVAVAAMAQALTDSNTGWDTMADTNARLAAMPAALAATVGEGVAWNLMFGMPQGPPLPGHDPVLRARTRANEGVRRARAGVQDGNAVCWTCVAAGAAMWDVCRQRSPPPRSLATCVNGALENLGADSLPLARGAGAACVRPGRSPRECEATAKGLTGPVADAFRSGVADPMAGADHPVLLLRDPK
jgi:hypothetical protein